MHYYCTYNNRNNNFQFFFGKIYSDMDFVKSKHSSELWFSGPYLVLVAWGISKMLNSLLVVQKSRYYLCLLHALLYISKTSQYQRTKKFNNRQGSMLYRFYRIPCIIMRLPSYLTTSVLKNFR